MLIQMNAVLLCLVTLKVFTCIIVCNHYKLTCRYDVAKFLNMKDDDKNLDIILESLPSDDKWNTADALQGAFYLAHLKRYDVNALKQTYNKRAFSEHESEKLVGKQQGLKIDNFVGGSSGMVPVKNENPMMTQYMAKLSVLKTGKGLSFYGQLSLCMCLGYQSPREEFVIFHYVIYSFFFCTHK